LELIRGSALLRGRTDAWRAVGERVGLVPTMGALHAGHDALIARARAENERVVVSIFVNPLQFGEGEDFERYPRNEDRDTTRCARAGVDAIWVPSVDEMYPPGVAVTTPDPGPIGDVFEGAARPGHFRGVLTVVHRLFEQIGPGRAYFGEKDAQQLFLVRRMSEAEPSLRIEVVGVPTVRDPDGLALSSRNAYLSGEERGQAGCLFLALAEAAELARAGERDVRVLIAAMAREIGATPLARLEYVAVVGDATFEPLDVLEGPARAIVAARFPSARLIDSLLLPMVPPEVPRD
jgi:pantoate--beta-alanine ligase